METTIKTRTYMGAINWALDHGFSAVSIYGMSENISEKLAAMKKDADEGDGEDTGWVIVGNMLFNVTDLWTDNEVYILY